MGVMLEEVVQARGLMLKSAIQLKPCCFSVPNETERDQKEVRAKLTSAANICLKTVTHFCFPESSFGVTSSRLC